MSRSKDIREMMEKIKSIGKVNRPTNVVNESSLSRVWQHVENRRPFAFVSLSRGDMNSDEKLEAYNKLKSEVRAKGYGFIETKGGYLEKGVDGKEDKDIIDELSLMIPNMKKEDALEIGQIDLGYGPQDTILYADGENFLGYLNTNPKHGDIGAIDMEFEYGKGHDALPMAKEAVKHYFSMLAKGKHKDKKFSFKPKPEDSDEDQTNEEFMMFEMRDKRYSKTGDWWKDYGVRIL